MALMAPEELEPCCREWQKRLRLQDWDIVIRAVERGSLEPPGRIGVVEWDGHERAAMIAVVLSEGLAESDRLYSPESTLVHELLHLVLWAWNPTDGSLEDDAKEQAINAIARALVTQARASPKET